MTTHPAIQLTGLRKSFGGVAAVDGIDLEIADGEFFSVLGPSGSGKTTVLRLIAGFETPTSGAIVLSGRDVTRLAPFDRDVNTVFQDYALFPHMTVRQNVEYALKVRKTPAAQRRERAEDALRGVRLEGFGDRKPAALSGGQRQRVALARALVNRPRVLLLDEPLGALDLKLREEMQVELKQIQRDAGITFVFVTHDQEEALTMSDRIAVMNRGRVEQIGAPAELYEQPATAFVAGFVGTSNMLTGAASREVIGRPGSFAVRPEKIHLHLLGDAAAGTASISAETSAGDPAEISANGRITEVIYAGPATRFIVDLDAGARIVVVAQNQQRSSAEVAALRAHRVRVSWHPNHVITVPSSTD